MTVCHLDARSNTDHDSIVHVTHSFLFAIHQTTHMTLPPKQPVVVAADAPAVAAPVEVAEVKAEAAAPAPAAEVAAAEVSRKCKLEL